MIFFFDLSTGINEIEQLTRNEQLKMLKGGVQGREAPRYSVLEESEMNELLTRIKVKSRFVNVLSGKLEPSLLRALKDVFFEIVFPTPT